MKKHRKQHIYRLLIFLLLCPLFPMKADGAGIATDDLRIRVGYFGMEADKYVEVSTYHWSELEENLPLHEQAYTFIRRNEEGEYKVVVDSAKGFYIDDLLAYADIGLSDVQALNFYTRDQETGYFTSFSLAELLQSHRYYFEDLPAHLIPLYDESGQLQGYDESEAFQHAVEVRPMLALEDSWVTYDVGTEHVQPDFSSMGTGNRFRLLFGQTSPMESRTNQTAKYVYAVNVMLDGQPEVVEELEPLKGTIGSHKATLTLSVGNLDILKNLQQLLRFDSSDGSVLQIDGWTVTPDDTYSDLVTVEISYTVLKGGSATLTGNLGGMELAVSAAVDTLPAEDDPQDRPSNGDHTAPDAGQGDTTPSQPENGYENEKKQQSGSSAASEQPKTDNPVTRETIRLSAEMSALLEQLGSDQGKPADTPQNEADSVPAVTPEDQRQVLLYTGLGSLAVCLSGAAAELLYFRKERDR